MNTTIRKADVSQPYKPVQKGNHQQSGNTESICSVFKQASDNEVPFFYSYQSTDGTAYYRSAGLVQGQSLEIGKNNRTNTYLGTGYSATDSSIRSVDGSTCGVLAPLYQRITNKK